MEIRTLQFPVLTKDQVELRVGTVKDGKGFTLLIYKDARVDANMLDNYVGSFNWQRQHKELKGNIYCSIGIYDDERSMWVWKEDCGAESNTEKEKGEASDSFKRAGFAWGIGRELYNAPFIWINQTDTINKFSHFVVKEMEIDGETREFVKLIIVEEKSGELVFKFNAKKKVEEKDEPKPKANQFDVERLPSNPNPSDKKCSVKSHQLSEICAYTITLTEDKSNAFFEWLKTRYNAECLQDLSEKQADELIKIIRARQDRGE